MEAYPTLQVLDSLHEEVSDINIEWSVFYQNKVRMIK